MPAVFYVAGAVLAKSLRKAQLLDRRQGSPPPVDPALRRVRRHRDGRDTARRPGAPGRRRARTSCRGSCRTARPPPSVGRKAGCRRRCGSCERSWWCCSSRRFCVRSASVCPVASCSASGSARCSSSTGGSITSRASCRPGSCAGSPTSCASAGSSRSGRAPTTCATGCRGPGAGYSPCSVCAAAGVWVYVAPPIDWVANNSYVLSGLVGLGWLLAMLALEDQLRHVGDIAAVQRFVAWVTDNSMSIYLWHTSALVLAFRPRRRAELARSVHHPRRGVRGAVGVDRGGRAPPRITRLDAEGRISQGACRTDRCS